MTEGFLGTLSRRLSHPKVFPRRLPSGLWVLLALCLVPCGASAQTLDERALWGLWKLQSATPEEHEAMLKACQEFREQHLGNPAVAVSDTITAWHLLKLGRRAETVALLIPYMRKKVDPLSRGAEIVAGSWLTRLDMETVKAALQFFYRKEIRYPKSLHELETYPQLPKDLEIRYKDRWDVPWSYRLTGMKQIPGLLDQKYELLSQTLGSRSDLAEALELPYADRLRFTPVAVLSSATGREILTVRFGHLPGESPEHDLGSVSRREVQAGVGMWTEGVYIAYVGERIVIACDRFHWQILAKPGQR